MGPGNLNKNCHRLSACVGFGPAPCSQLRAGGWPGRVLVSTVRGAHLDWHVGPGAPIARLGHGLNLGLAPWRPYGFGPALQQQLVAHSETTTTALGSLFALNTGAHPFRVFLAVAGGRAVE